MIDTNTPSQTTRLAQLLTEMNQEGNFPLAVITDRDGFPIASVCSDGQDADRQSAVVALVQRTAQQVQDRMGMAATDEFSLYDKDGKRLVCRPFMASGHALILAVVVPDKDKPYRRLTTRTVNAIRNLWKE